MAVDVVPPQESCWANRARGDGRVMRRRFIGEVDLGGGVRARTALQARIRDGGRFAVGMDVGVRIDRAMLPFRPVD
ncbi:hypothetical protein [Stappia sp.]|uniref:hypothetical protein n=1 Tax=Stappia sp. TaxID=1870903 RepID=UPI003A9A6572